MLGQVAYFLPLLALLAAQVFYCFRKEVTSILHMQAVTIVCCHK
jgi:hypothetical protein